jgi:predicted protein tyrosine phosphatase
MLYLRLRKLDVIELNAMRVDVYNRGQAVDLEPVEGTVVISISSPGDPANLKEGWEDVLRLEFHDVVKIPTDIPDIRAFCQTDADAVHEFVDKHVADGKNFAIHCDAGVSRSVAVGVFLREVHEAELTLHAINTDVAANSRVTRCLMRKYWVDRFAERLGE